MSGLNALTVVNFYREFRERIQLELKESDQIIGGEGITVQIDECTFGRRKYNRGHSVTGAWALGGVDDSPEKTIFLIEVPDRSQKTLTAIILDHVLPGSLIITDGWKGYNNLKNHYVHLTVNHSQNYKDPETQASTNAIEDMEWH